MQTGALAVTGEGKTDLILRGWPREVVVVFRHKHDFVPCNPSHHHDKLSYRIKFEDEDPREHHKPGHRHRNRMYLLEISWKVEGLREVDWCVIY